MSDSQTLKEIYLCYATSLNMKLLPEAIEHGVGKSPVLLGDKDIDFLEQFPRKYWSQAMKKRYDLFFNYLLNLQKLRDAVYKKNYDAMERKAKKFFSQHKGKGLSDFAVDRHSRQQAQAMSKAAATQLLPAGGAISADAFNKIAAGLPPEEIKRLKNISNQINNFYLKDDPYEFSDFATGNEKPKNYQAQSFLSDLAKELEGGYGEDKGYDLHNPKIIRHDKGEPVYSTDGFQFPEFENLQKQLNQHLIHVHNQMALPSDEADIARMAGAVPKEESKVLNKEALKPVAKQIKKIFMRDALREMQAKRAADPKFHFTKDQVEKAAEQRTNSYLEKFTDPNKFKNFLKDRFGFSDQEIKSVDLPYMAAEIANSMVGKTRQSKNKITVPYKKTTVKEVGEDGTVKDVETEIPAIPKSTLYRDIHGYGANLLPPEKRTDSQTFSPSVGYTLGKQEGIGQKYFDPILFEKLVDNWKALKNKSIEDPVERAKFEKYMSDHGITEKTTLKDLHDMAKRHYYATAKPSEYKQGSDVAATYSMHPTRMTPGADFLNLAHKQNRYDWLMKLLNDPKRGIAVTEKDNPITLANFINGIVGSVVTPGKYENPIEKMLLARVGDKLNTFAQLRVLEHMNTKGIVHNVNRDPDTREKKRIWRGNPRVIARIVKKELKRYLDQDLLTGSARKKGDFLSVLDDESTKDLTCKQGNRRYATGACMFGAAIMKIEDVMQKGARQALSKGGSVPGDINAERQHVSNLILGYKEMAQAIYVLQTAVYKAQKKQESGEITAKDDVEAKQKARYDVTEFFKANAGLDDTQFVTKIYQDYNSLMEQLKGLASPKELKDIQAKTPAFAGKRGKQLSAEEIKQRLFQREAGSRTLGQGMTNFDSLSVPELVTAYRTAIADKPSQYEKIAEEMLSQINVGAKKEELRSALAPEMERIKQEISRVANRQYVDNFRDYFFFDTSDMEDASYDMESDPEKMLEIAKDVAKFAPDKLLQHISADMKDNFKWTPTLEPDDTPEQRQEISKQLQLLNKYKNVRLATRKIIDDEIKVRGLYEDMVTMLNNPRASLKLLGQDRAPKTRKNK